MALTQTTGRDVLRGDRLRVVVWNMAQKPQGWAALDRLEPDICLLNEAVVPEGRTGVWNAAGTIGRDGKKRPWTAAVVSRFPISQITDARARWRQKERNVPFECSRPGSWVAAKVETPIGQVTAVALYGLLDEFSDASVHRSLSELSPIFTDGRYRGQVILGGDLNTGTQWRAAEADFNARDRGVLQRIEDHGLVDCLRAARAPGRLEGCPCTAGDACEHVRTRWHAPRPDVPYQTDYLFASSKTRLALISCEPLYSEDWRRLSDHAPVVADFRILLGL